MPMYATKGNGRGTESRQTNINIFICTLIEIMSTSDSWREFELKCELTKQVSVNLTTFVKFPERPTDISARTE